MNSDILAGLDFFEREKGIKRDVLLEAINTAVLTAARKAVGPAKDLRVEIDSKTGEIKAYAKLTVVEKVANKHDEISFKTARMFKGDIQLAEEIEVPVTPKDFGRIAAQTAKQAMMQRIRLAEKEMIYDEFKDRAGEIVSGTVRRFDRSDVIVDLGKFEALMPNRERVQTEDYNIGDRLRAYVVAVENGARGPEIILSTAIRISCAGFLKWRSARSTTAPWRSRASPARPATGRRSRSSARMKKSIPSARAWACAARG